MPKCLGLTGRALLFRPIVASPVFVGNNPISSLPLFLLSGIPSISRYFALWHLLLPISLPCAYGYQLEYTPEHIY
ncbi:hypothetical protein IW261DRAFT_111032 [Armillaria novae-zelandiae]|uniref:Uncharacterized protein n=1 Tax=Armillaria novae-zelandiae TaxID=153914 RepID=A0AA39PB01_9AGAR|nr:hypothetical protein IW261DRAFT_111032 [Armillaria novae-zelandiae]